MFILELTYGKPLSEVEKYLSGHNAYLDKYYAAGKFICSGRKNPRSGGIILCNAQDLNEANNIICEDPFYKEQIANYEITEFCPSKYTDGFKTFI